MQNALVCFQELFSFLGRAMDAHLDAVVPTLAKRAAENSAFLSAEADIALGAMIANVSDARALAALLAIAGHKTPGVRARVAAHVEACVRKMGPRCSRELLERCARTD